MCQEDTILTSKIAYLSIVLSALLLSAPAFAQSQSSSGSDPFTGVPSVDSDEMSAVSGELAGGISAGVSTHIGSENHGAGAQGAGGVTSNAILTTTTDVSASGSHDFANQGNVSITIYNNNGGGN